MPHLNPLSRPSLHSLRLMYDCRHDADALFHLCDGVRIAGAVDLQIPYASSLMVGCKTPYLPRYIKMLKDLLPRRDFLRLETVKAAGRAAFAPECGGSYDAWAVRPLPQLLLFYLTIDVCHMFKLHDRLVAAAADSPGSKFNIADVARATAKRMAKTCQQAELPWPYGKEWSQLDFTCLKAPPSAPAAAPLQRFDSELALMAASLRRLSLPAI